MTFITIAVIVAFVAVLAAVAYGAYQLSLWTFGVSQTSLWEVFLKFPDLYIFNMKSILENSYTSPAHFVKDQINTKVISKFIGHSDVKTTMRYINPTDEYLKEVMIR